MSQFDRLSRAQIDEAFRSALDRNDDSQMDAIEEGITTITPEGRVATNATREIIATRRYGTDFSPLNNPADRTETVG